MAVESRPLKPSQNQVFTLLMYVIPGWAQAIGWKTLGTSIVKLEAWSAPRVGYTQLLTALTFFRLKAPRDSVALETIANDRSRSRASN